MRDALKDLVDQFWPRDAVGDGTVGVDASVFGNVSVGEAREAGVLEAIRRGSRPGSRGATLLIYLLNFRAHGAHFPVITQTTS